MHDIIKTGDWYICDTCLEQLGDVEQALAHVESFHPVFDTN